MSETDSAATRLCTACGLCCNGVMFHTVQLQPKDVPQDLVALGLRIRRKKGRAYFAQPCAAFEGHACAIYAQRPERCRLFACQQLRRVEARQITEAMALETIGEAKARADRLDALSRRPNGSLRKGPLARRCETALAEPFDAITQPEISAQRAELADGLAELNALLDRDFRLPPEHGKY